MHVFIVKFCFFFCNYHYQFLDPSESHTFLQFLWDKESTKEKSIHYSLVFRLLMYMGILSQSQEHKCRIFICTQYLVLMQWASFFLISRCMSVKYSFVPDIQTILVQLPFPVLVYMSVKHSFVIKPTKMYRCNQYLNPSKCIIHYQNVHIYLVFMYMYIFNWCINPSKYASVQVIRILKVLALFISPSSESCTV